jgi:tRNA(His) guanylyltransferase
MDLGDRMKQYELSAERYLVRRVPVTIRVDGNCFHNWTKGLSRPFDKELRECFTYAAYRLCSEIAGARFAYMQSDEISILVIDYQNLDSEGWFNYRAAKMQSIAASMCTAAFNSACEKCLPEHLKKKGPAYFDARAYNIPKEDVCNYVLWRQRDCERNSVSSLAQAHFSHKELHQKNSSDKQDMLMLKKNINWNDLPTLYKRGSCLYKVQLKYEKNNVVTMRNSWIMDLQMPVISRDRAYVERWLDPETSVTELPNEYISDFIL